jgi:D-hexose-6-phosphate mutarotase
MDRTSLPSTVALETGEGGLPRLAIVNPLARAEIYLHGAHVTAWQPAGHPPVLWMSGQSLWNAAKPIRGGVPICFPWFGPHASDAAAPSHGFARLRDWTLVEARDGELGETHLAFELTPEASRPAAWPHAFAATYRVSVGRSLILSLEVHNPGPEPFTFEEALHTYFAVQDVRAVEIRGLENAEYLDKVGGTTTRNQGPDPIQVTAETDRVYLNSQAMCTIHDPGLDRWIEVRKSGSEATVVWNPWVAKARAMPDFGDDEWPEMVCVETGNVNVHAVTLAPGGRHVMNAMIDVVSTWPMPTAPTPRP